MSRASGLLALFGEPSPSRVLRALRPLDYTHTRKLKRTYIHRAYMILGDSIFGNTLEVASYLIFACTDSVFQVMSLLQQYARSVSARVASYFFVCPHVCQYVHQTTTCDLTTREGWCAVTLPRICSTAPHHTRNALATKGAALTKMRKYIICALHGKRNRI